MIACACDIWHGTVNKPCPCTCHKLPDLTPEQVEDLVAIQQHIREGWYADDRRPMVYSESGKVAPWRVSLEVE